MIMENSSASTEWFDVVDENDCVIGKETRQEVHRKKLLHRAIHVFVFRADGSLYLQKRSATKDTAPNKWVSSCSGHVDSGEVYEESALRELGEELGIQATPNDLQEIMAVPAVPETGYEFVRLYRIENFEGTVVPDPEEVAGGTWKKPEEIDEWIRRAPRDFSLSFLYLWELYGKHR